jgi:hypothetical protein
VRKAINENPIVQMALLGGLVLIVGFLLLTRVMGGHKASTAPTSTTPTTSAPAGGTATTPSTAPSTGTATVPSTGTATAPTGSATAVPSGKLVAGPGLPRAVASAYAHNKAVVILITRRHGIDDSAVKASVELLRANGSLAVFVANAGKISRFSRITEGVDVNRVPALVVVRPKRLTGGGPPTAAVSYGFRSPDSVAQAVRDSLYKGPTNLPYYPK